MTTPSERPGEKVEVPRPTVWPLVLSFGVAMMVIGLATYLAFSVVGLLLFVGGLAGWINTLLPGRGHVEEAHVPEGQRPQRITPRPGSVDQLVSGMPGYRFRLPEKVRPISAGVKGGIVGGLVMPIPAFVYGLISGNGIWFPINLLAGMVLPVEPDLTQDQLRAFSLSSLVIGTCIHVIMSLTIGLIYGVLLPTLPAKSSGQIVWGGVIMPLIWTAVTYGLMDVVNPTMKKYVDWPYFLVSQLVFGLVASIVVVRSEQIAIPPLRGASAEPAPREP